MNRMVGSDPDQLDALAQQLVVGVQLLASTRTTLDQQLMSGPWQGRDAEQFREAWQSVLLPRLSSTSASLEEAAALLRLNAAEQRLASDAGVGLGAAVGAAAGGSLADAGSGSALDQRIAELKQQIDQARREGRDPHDYASVLREYYEALAARRAGIDLGSWNPEEGVDGNRQTMEEVYTYYGKLFLAHPELQWAGMANLVGPSFGAGFLDLDAISDMSASLSDAVDELPGFVRARLPPYVIALAELGDLSAADVRFYESKLMGIQQAIFLDQAVMHEAYLEGGVAAIEELHAANPVVDDRAVQAWRDIASGDPERIARGNEDLLWREQNQIIANSYNQMRHHLPSGEAVTYALGVLGAPTIEYAKTAGQYDPLEVRADVNLPYSPLHGSASVQTPLPAFNISDQEARWEMINRDTLPAYQEWLRENPEEVRAEVERDIHGRMKEQRLWHQRQEIYDRLTSDWEVRVDAGWGRGRSG